MTSLISFTANQACQLLDAIGDYNGIITAYISQCRTGQS